MRCSRCWGEGTIDRNGLDYACGRCDGKGVVPSIVEVKTMEYSLSNGGLTQQFNSLDEMFAFIRKVGEIPGWTIRVHHL